MPKILTIWPCIEKEQNETGFFGAWLLRPFNLLMYFVPSREGYGMQYILTYWLEDPLFMSHPWGKLWGTRLESNPAHWSDRKSDLPKGMQLAHGYTRTWPDSKSFLRQCSAVCWLPVSVRVIGAVAGVSSPEEVVRGGQSGLVFIPLPVYNGVPHPCLHGVCLFFKFKKRRENHHTNNECQF